MDTEHSQRTAVELFHILFMEQLGHKLDKRLYALKGGCNLRFFLGSIRYSEDIDIDVHTVAPMTLKNSVDKILSGVSFIHMLRTHQMSIVNFSTPKQTATTQRWKIQLKIATQSLPINTKIEFSRRDSTAEAITEVLPRQITTVYKLKPIFISHYKADMAVEQKIKALIHRNETQARDVFDIYHLIHSYNIDIQNKFNNTELKKAAENTIGIDFPIFKSQVVSYLEPAYQAQYDDAEIWSTIVVAVCDYIEKHLS